jgi:hypothetical protein
LSNPLIGRDSIRGNFDREEVKEEKKTGVSGSHASNVRRKEELEMCDIQKFFSDENVAHTYIGRI